MSIAFMGDNASASESEGDDEADGSEGNADEGCSDLGSPEDAALLMAATKKAAEQVAKKKAGPPLGVLRVPATMASGLSGRTGEFRVAAEILRIGFNVAKPYWDIGGWDLVAFVDVGHLLIPVPIQVKTVQISWHEDRKTQQPKPGATRTVQDLKKSYIEKGVSVAVYLPDKDAIFFFPDEASVREAFHAITRRTLKYDDFASDDDVPLGVPEASEDFDAKWRVPRDPTDGSRLAERLRSRAQDLYDQARWGIVADAAVDAHQTEPVEPS